MRMQPASRTILLAAGAIALVLGACRYRQEAPAAAPPAASAGTPSADAGGLRLERVVMLMRHGGRPPTKPAIGPPGTADKPWPKWGAAFGELTPHGYDAVKLLGAWDREHWEALGLLPPDRCLDKTELEMEASYKSRTQDTARALAEGMMPGCPVEIPHPAADEDDYLFHPLATGKLAYDAAAAIEQARARQPQGGMAAEIRDNAGLFALLDQALGCCTPATCSDGKARACDLSRWPAALETGDDGAVSVGDPFSLASTIGQTFLLEYLEGMPMEDVAWGRVDEAGIGKLLQFHVLKYKYEARTPYVALRTAAPLASRMLDALDHGAKLTVLAGHDTNIAQLGGFFDLHWTVPGYPRDDPPPGGAIGFELLSDAAGAKYVRAFYRSQTMPQVRELQPLDEDNPASWEILPIPGCAEPCRFDSFAALTRGKLAEAGFAAATPRH
jgi:4-phytase/acid phosphatase